MSKLLKALLLAACAGICLMVFFLLVLLTRTHSPNGSLETLHQFFNELFNELYKGRAVQELSGMWLIGFVVCLIFGTPALLIIDKYFSRFKTRYIIGGFVAGWVAWFFMVGPLLTTSPWLSVDSWIDSGINYVGLYVWMGFSTGLLFTVLLWLLEKLKSKKP